MRVYIRFIFVCLFLVCSCNKNDNNSDSEIRERYFNLEKAGWKSKSYKQKVDNINFTATEVPIVYYLLSSLGSNNVAKIDSLYEVNKRDRVYEFEFADENEDDLLKEKYTNMDYEDSVKYLSFSIDKDYYLVTSKNDTVRCSGVLFERSFKVAPYNKVLLFFSDIDTEDKVQLVYQDKLFQKGTLKFRFKDPILKL